VLIVLSRDNIGKESIEEDIIKELMSLRNYLEKRVQELEDEAEKLKSLFKIVDEVIVTKSFKKAETIPVAKPVPPPRPKFNEEIPLKTSIGTLLATIYVWEDEARMIPAEGITLTLNTPPFQTFLITRILEPMKAKDSEDSQKGEVLPNKIFSYETITEGDLIKELIIRNFGTRKRLREIISSARWTLEKMYEKIGTSDTEI